MKLSYDLDDKSVEFRVPKGTYSEDALRLAAQVLSRRAETYASDEGKHWEVVLEAKAAKAGKPELRALAGEFHNELVNQEYRFVVGAFNRNITDIVVTQALYSARGDESTVKRRDEDDPEFKKTVAELMKRTQGEIERTMPKKIADKGAPLPAAGAEDFNS